MVARFLAFLFVSAIAVFAQGAAPVKAGDRAPEIDWSKLVQSPESAKYQPSLAGQYTVLQFLLPVTANAQAIGQWNELIAKFRDRPVQFIWIATENWSVVQPFLRDHPMAGWLLIDEKNEAASAYGCEMGDDVIIDPSGKIAGFTSFPNEDQLSAALDGKAVAVTRHEGDDQVVRKLIEEGKVLLDAEPDRMVLPRPRTPEKPDIALSYEVHISPSNAKGTDGSAGPDFWVQRGFDLKTMISIVYEKDQSRVVLPDSLNPDDRFDFVVVLPEERDEQTIHQLVQRAIEKRFNLSAVVESKPAEVYVMTAIKGKTPPAKAGAVAGGMSFASTSTWDFSKLSLPPGTPPTPEAIEKALKEMAKHPEELGISNLSAGDSTIEHLREMIEQSVGRPVIDETGLEGVYDFEVHGDAKNADDFIRNLREQTGIVLTPATRSIEFLTVRSLN